MRLSLLARASLLSIALSTITACIESHLVDCGNGLACPVGLVCAQLTDPDESSCVSTEQVEACVGHGEDEACTVTGAPPSSCQGGVCLPIVCGNRRVDLGEACDDGNTVTGDRTCSADCRSNETCGNGSVDPLVLVAGTGLANEQCDDGNLISADGCSSTCAVESKRWAQLDLPVPPLGGAVMVYDAGRNRMMLFGGHANDSDGAYSDAVYEWNGASWTQIPTTIAPTGRANHGMAYDAARRRVIMFGGLVGDDDGPLNDMWTWDGNVWRRIVPPSIPSARSKFGMTYDAAYQRVVLFGGFDGTRASDETWTWDGTTWTQLITPVRPPGRSGHVMAYDPRRAVIVMAGGSDDQRPTGSEELRDTWELSGSTWTQTTTSLPVQLDALAAMAYDATSSRMIAYGGRSGGTVSSETLAYSNSTWTALVNTTPGPRLNLALASDPNTGVMLLFGGTAGGVTFLDTTYRWNGTTWSLPSPAFRPAPVSGAASALDPARGRVLAFGGRDSTPAPVNTLVSYDGTRWRSHTSAGPSPRYYSGLAFDRAHDQLVQFGGWDAADALVPAETWLWNGTAWSLATPAMSPPPRVGPAMTYDPARQRVVLFGGATASNMPLDDTWEWDGTTWAPIPTTTRPPRRAIAEMTYDETRGVVLLSGGYTFAIGAAQAVLNDLWQYDGTDWKQLSGPTPLPNRLLSPMAYDRAAGDAVVFGGNRFGGGLFSDTWAWDGVSWVETYGAHPPSRGNHSAFSSPDGTGVIVFAGQIGDAPTTLTDDVWSLRYENAQPREICSIVADNDGDGLSGCADPDCWPRCSPFCPPGSQCAATAPRCGDGVCNGALENCRMCAQDCACVAACGDTFCEGDETQASCPGDCTP